ncbi:unnamed protein product [Amoebophrya sp. A25]|nr:unnamed protein product [Amoebophrya sp. A25]|eukprot:GSA25T00005431001.1
MAGRMCGCEPRAAKEGGANARRPKSARLAEVTEAQRCGGCGRWIFHIIRRHLVEIIVTAAELEHEHWELQEQVLEYLEQLPERHPLQEQRLEPWAQHQRLPFQSPLFPYSRRVEICSNWRLP